MSQSSWPPQQPLGTEQGGQLPPMPSYPPSVQPSVPRTPPAAPGEGPPPAAGYGAPPAAGFGPPPPAPPPRSQGRAPKPVVGVAVALAIAVLGGLVHALFLSAGFDPVENSYPMLGWVGVLTGALVGVAVGLLARSRLVPQLIGGVIALAGVAFGELFGTVLALHDDFSSAIEEFFTDVIPVWELWTAVSGPAHYVLLGMVPVAAVAAAQVCGQLLRGRAQPVLPDSVPPGPVRS